MQAPFRNDNWGKCRAMAHLQGKNNGWGDTSSKGEEFCHTGAIHHCSKTHQQTKPVRVAGLWSDRNLEDSLPSFTENPIALPDFLQWKGMREQRSEIYPPMPHHLHESSHPFFSTGAQGRHYALIADPRIE